MVIGDNDSAEENQNLLTASGSSTSDRTSYGSTEQHKSAIDGAALRKGTDIQQEGEEFDNVPAEKRQLGLYSTIFLIFNCVTGTGIYATPSNILRFSGSVGVSLAMWLVGAVIALCGTAVFVELGTGLPRSGGEKNYLEYVYRKPKFLVTCSYASYVLITGSGPANGIVFSEYLINALSINPSQFNIRLVAILCLAFVCLIHGTKMKWGLRLQNTLGILKLFIMMSIVLCGLFSLVGVPGSSTSPNAFVSGLYNVIWSFQGYQNANYVLSEVRNPIATIKRAAPLAMLFVAAILLSMNIAYFAVVSKSDVLGSNRIIVALFFRNLFGHTAEKAVSAFIAFSTLSSILASQFSHGRVIQELGREGIIPHSSFFASNKPFNAPLAGLFTVTFVSCVYLSVVPAGDAYLFLISLRSYSVALINAFVSLGLLLLYTSTYRRWSWDPPFQAPKIFVLLYFVSNVFLVVVPFIPPIPGARNYHELPYWSHAVGSLSISLFGIAYWYYWSIWRPKRYRYKLQREWVLQNDRVSKYVFRRVPTLSVDHS